LGVQSLDDDLLGRLGRIHDSRVALQAIDAAQAAGFARLNADLMYGLPGQTVSLAHSDVQRLLDLGVKHLSHYHLTLESATPLGRAPPGDLPDEHSLLAMEGACRAEMAAQGLDRYEVSAFAAAGQQCRHNLNYWTYGDYLGIGPGAHGKLTLAPGEIVRQVAEGSPQRWLQVSGTDQAIAEQWALSRDEVVFELFANGLRMPAGISPCTAEQNTGLAWRNLERRVAHLLDNGWLEWNSGRLSVAESRFEMLDAALESLITAS
jgi:oxygen-independent coproporphyrinogen-3 oxidase